MSVDYFLVEFFSNFFSVSVAVVDWIYYYLSLLLIAVHLKVGRSLRQMFRWAVSVEFSFIEQRGSGAPERRRLKWRGHRVTARSNYLADNAVPSCRRQFYCILVSLFL